MVKVKLCFNVNVYRKLSLKSNKFSTASGIPILQSICQWSDIFYKEDAENEMTQCQKCDILQSFYKNKIALPICIIYNKDYWWKKENDIPQL